MPLFTARIAPRLAACVAVLTLVVSAACGRHGTDTPPPPDTLAAAYTLRGEAPVGFSTFEHDRGAGDPLVVKAWYPADLEDVTKAPYAYRVNMDSEGFPEGPVHFWGFAHEDAPPGTDGPYPLVVLSHGFGMNAEFYHPLAEHLASHGFVVLGPEHTEYNWADDVLKATAQRPRDVSDTIDLAESGILNGAINTEHVAVVGHSYGGYTALALAGARFDPPQLAERCVDVSDPFTDEYFCQPFVGHEATLAELVGLDDVPDGLWPTSMTDDRVDAIIPMAGDAYLFGEDGLAEISLPTLLIGGTGDSGTPWDWGAGLSYDNIRSEERYLAAFDGAEHFLPVASCDTMPFVGQMPLALQVFMCNDFAWDKAGGLAQINQLSTAFLKLTLRGDDASRDVLDPALREPVEGLEVTMR